MPDRKEIIEVAGRSVPVSNPGKVYFPQTGHTKLDLVRYYLSVADGALRGVAGRPMVLKRYVNGAEGEAFFQKRAPSSRPDWIETVVLSFPSGRTAEEVVVTDAAGLAHGIAAHAGRVAGVVFAVALLDAAIIGAFAVSLSTAYAVGDTLGLKHSLHRGVGQAKGFYAIYTALIAVAAAIVLVPGAPLGLIIEGVQALAGVLLPAAAVFLLMLCNDRAVLGPWVNRRGTNVFTSAVIALLVAMSIVLTASVLDPGITERQILSIFLGCAVLSIAGGGWVLIRSLRVHSSVEVDRRDRETWRMPPLNVLTKPVMSTGRKIALTILRSYLAIAMVLVIVRLVQMALAH